MSMAATAVRIVGVIRISARGGSGNEFFCGWRLVWLQSMRCGMNLFMLLYRELRGDFVIVFGPRRDPARWCMVVEYEQMKLLDSSSPS
jgi:hypothetical protein